jgi:aminoglycoside phosphotransferase
MKTNVSTKREISSDVSDYFIKWAKDLIGNETIVSKEHHGDEGAVYKIDSKKGNYFLKIKNNSNFLKERERLAWFENKLPVPKLVGFAEKDGTGAVLLTALEGKNLAVLCKEWPAEKVTTKLADAIHKFHKTNTEGWIFDKLDSKKILVHGDACLPNFIFMDDEFSGYIDIGDAQLANPEVDLAATIWSLQYNMGEGHGAQLLKKYGWDNTTEEEVERFRQIYIDYQHAEGFSL